MSPKRERERSWVETVKENECEIWQKETHSDQNKKTNTTNTKSVKALTLVHNLLCALTGYCIVVCDHIGSYYDVIYFVKCVSLLTLLLGMPLLLSKKKVCLCCKAFCMYCIIVFLYCFFPSGPPLLLLFYFFRFLRIWPTNNNLFIFSMEPITIYLYINNSYFLLYKRKRPMEFLFKNMVFVSSFFFFLSFISQFNEFILLGHFIFSMIVAFSFSFFLFRMVCSMNIPYNLTFLVAVCVQLHGKR